MGRKYSQSAGWMREIWALAIFVGGFALYDWQEGGENERMLALLLMFGAGIFMCFAMVERLFFIPRIRGRQDPADAVEMSSIGDISRNETVNYDGPRRPPVGATGAGAAEAGPDGLDPVPPPREDYYDEADAEMAAAEARAEMDAEEERQARAELESALSDPFFSDGDKK